MALVFVVVFACVGTVACGSNRSTGELRVDADGVTIHAHVVGGSDAATTVITVHGGPGLSLGTMASFDGLASQHVRVVGYDQRGSGASTSPADGDFGLRAQVADLEALREALGAATVQLVGESWGGAIAAAYAATYPERVTALVLLGAMPLDREEFLAGQRRFLAHIDQLQHDGIVSKPLPPAADGSCLPTLNATLPAYLADPSSHPTVEFPSCTAVTARATFDDFTTDGSVEQFGDQLGTYRGRALVLMGSADAFGLEWLDRNVALLSGATLEQQAIEHAGHLLMVDRPDEVFDMVHTFLSG
jgi:proline iminopeptidase